MTDNPLKQYFRRPAIYINLPSGIGAYTPDVVTMTENGELPVYPMTAIDEITSKTPDALLNGAAVAEIIRSCVPNIKNPWGIYSVDLDAILVAIRCASNGTTMEVETTCPACKEEAKYDINLVPILASMKCGDYNTPLQVHDLQIKFRPLTYSEMNEVSKAQFDFQRKFVEIDKIEDFDQKSAASKAALLELTDLTMRTVTAAIEQIATPTTSVVDKNHIYEFLKNCDRDAYAQIRDHNATLREQTEIKPFDVKCMHCSHQYKQPFTLNVADFFE